MSKELFVDTQRERWWFSDVSTEAAEQLAATISVPTVVAKLLLTRNIGEGDIDSMQRVISPPDSLIGRYDQITDPQNLEKALSRIERAIGEENIVVNGDPDADGITATTVLVAGLRHLGATVGYDFPIRAKEGHGVQPRIIDEAEAAGASLILTADCGSKDVQAIEYANTKGIDVIVIDHHILGRQNPAAYAMVNPFCVSDDTPFKKLAAAGVALKVVLALFDRLKVQMPPDFLSYLLACSALGTISDRMSLLEPMNRILVTKGVEALNDTRMEGLKALKNVSLHHHVRLRAREIARTIVPRINAPGRIGDREEGIADSQMVVDLLLLGMGEKNAQLASEVAQEFAEVLHIQRSLKKGIPASEEAAIVDDINEKRKFITSKIEDEIDYLIKTQVDPENDRIIIIQGQDWNPGVIGIDTDRLRDRFLRPAMILTEYSGNPYIRGSVRSIPTINIYRILESVADEFESEKGRPLFKSVVDTRHGKQEINAFGGHAVACGFSIHKDDIDSFIGRLRAKIETLDADQFHFFHEILDTIDFKQLNIKLVHELDKISPFGEKFDFPLFYLKECYVSAGKPFGNKYQEARTPHVEFWVYEKLGKRRRPSNKCLAVGFGLWEKFSEIKMAAPEGKVDLIFSLEQMKRGRSRDVLRLNVVDIRLSQGEIVDP